MKDVARHDYFEDENGSRFYRDVLTDEEDGSSFAYISPMDQFWVDGIEYDSRYRTADHGARRLMIEFPGTNGESCPEDDCSVCNPFEEDDDDDDY